MYRPRDIDRSVVHNLPTTLKITPTVLVIHLKKVYAPTSGLAHIAVDASPFNNTTIGRAHCTVKFSYPWQLLHHAEAPHILRHCLGASSPPVRTESLQDKVSIPRSCQPLMVKF